MHSDLKYATLTAWSSATMLEKLLMNDHSYTALVAALGDPGTGTGLLRIQWKSLDILSTRLYCEETRSFIVATLIAREKLIETISQR